MRYAAQTSLSSLSTSRRPSSRWRGRTTGSGTSSAPRWRSGTRPATTRPCSIGRSVVGPQSRPCAGTAHPRPQLLGLECVPKLSEGPFIGKNKGDVERNMRTLRDRIVDVYKARGKPLALVRPRRPASLGSPTILMKPRIRIAARHQFSPRASPCARRPSAAVATAVVADQ